MDIVNKVIGGLVGNKASRDLKVLEPYKELINTDFDRLEVFSNDELSAESEALKNRIREAIVEERQEINDLKNSLEDSKVDVEEKESGEEGYDR